MKLDYVRERALIILKDILENKGYSNLALETALNDNKLRDIDRAFISELVYGTLRFLITIDAYIAKFSKVKIKKISPWIINILRLGVYQIVYMRVPESAACNESVKLAKRYGHSASSGFVNGILRSIATGYEKVVFDSLEEKYSFPNWLINRWIKKLGKDFTIDLMNSLNQRPKISIRVNMLKTGLHEFEEIMEKEGSKVEKCKYIDSAYYLDSSEIDKLSSFKRGLFYVQDQSSMIAAKVLDPKRGQKVIDVCAAPGGKSSYIASIMNNEGLLISGDIHPHRINLLHENFARLGITMAKPVLMDALIFNPEYENMFDCVLVDAPCSGFGIIRKKPEIKWARTLSDIEEISHIQYEILKNSARYVKPNGVLVYSTCTIETTENEDILNKFLLENEDKFSPESIDEFLPVNLNKLSQESINEFLPEGINKSLPDNLNITLPKGMHLRNEKDFYITLYPNIHETDGFFIGRLRKKG